MGDIQYAFEDWFINLHGDVDETLVDKKDEQGNYEDELVNNLWFAFRAGYVRAE